MRTLEPAGHVGADPGGKRHPGADAVLPAAAANALFQRAAGAGNGGGNADGSKRTGVDGRREMEYRCFVFAPRKAMLRLIALFEYLTHLPKISFDLCGIMK